MKKTIFTLVAAIAAVGWMHANTTSPSKPLVIKKAQGTITIDGIGNEATWTSISKVVPALNGAAGDPNFGGWFKLTYDDD
ncbi:MAG: hypothetical protein ACP5PZ_11800, partial [Bacteroidales bacterium]